MAFFHSHLITRWSEKKKKKTMDIYPILETYFPKS